MPLTTSQSALLAEPNTLHYSVLPQHKHDYYCRNYIEKEYTLEDYESFEKHLLRVQIIRSVTSTPMAEPRTTRWYNLDYKPKKAAKRLFQEIDEGCDTIVYHRPFNI